METDVAESQLLAVSDILRLARTTTKEKEEILLEPFNYIFRAPGTDKLMSTKLPNALNYWLKIPQDKFNAIKEIGQEVQVSGLVFDDIQDNSNLRYGMPAAHNVYGIAMAVNAALYTIPIGMEKVIELNHPEAVRIYAEQWIQLCRGQGIEIYWRENYTCPSEAEYKVMVMQKTGGLYFLILRLMQLFSDYKKDITNLVGILGLYLQIRDDYCSLYLDELARDKGYCEDLSEGKFNFLIVHAIQTTAGGIQVMNILKQRTNDIELKRHCINLLKKCGSYAYTGTVLEELDKQARDEIARLGGNPVLIKVLDDLLSWKYQSGSQQKSEENTF
ncbi:unnamed protein product [Xylocopa violacea]|uniref:Geranylgeranyl pyrophosphate synthase n=1 Tax=Xylocopa violacea TaxID=135666 RepID=A0ABP1P4T1_XYLVO